MVSRSHFSSKTFFAPKCSRTPIKASKNVSAMFGTGKRDKNRSSRPFIFWLPSNPMAFEKVCHEEWPLSRNFFFKKNIDIFCRIEISAKKNFFSPNFFFSVSLYENMSILPPDAKLPFAKVLPFTNGNFASFSNTLNHANGHLQGTQQGWSTAHENLKTLQIR